MSAQVRHATVAALHDEIRADMALSQHDYRAAADFGKQVLDQQNVGIELTVAAKSAMGAAKMGAGSTPRSVAALAEAAALAEKSGSALLLAETRLAYAEAAFANGEAQSVVRRRVRGAAVVRQCGQSRRGMAELAGGIGRGQGIGELRTLSGMRSEGLAGTCHRATDVDSDSYKSYLARPDIQDRGRQLATLAAAR